MTHTKNNKLADSKNVNDKNYLQLLIEWIYTTLDKQGNRQIRHLDTIKC